MDIREQAVRFAVHQLRNANDWQEAEHALANDSLCRHYHVASVDTRRQTQGLQQRSPG